MVAVVTGASGFIGSHLCEHLLASGDFVRGVDAFTDYYSRRTKERSSWGSDFRQYVSQNFLVTQRLLDALAKDPPHKLVCASSSSVYGDVPRYPTAEWMRPRPVSPYGVTKLAAEHLCEVYRKQGAVKTASLRLFHRLRPAPEARYGVRPSGVVRHPARDVRAVWGRRAATRLHVRR
jgi:nucleoside-diphosphate-sugar epimerase